MIYFFISYSKCRTSKLSSETLSVKFLFYLHSRFLNLRANLDVEIHQKSVENLFFFNGLKNNGFCSFQIRQKTMDFRIDFFKFVYVFPSKNLSKLMDFMKGIYKIRKNKSTISILIKNKLGN